MYLRMGWVVGHAGLFQTLIIVTLSTGITSLTSLSISATATNMKVEGGGAYFMISRSLGVEAGAAIGIPLFISQALGISFYVVGFSESLQHIFPEIPLVLVSVVVLILLTIVTFISVDLALRVQFGVFVVIVLSMAAFLYGPLEPPEFTAKPFTGDTHGFWHVFAVFFPAVTGILTGVSMSGDLKNPGKSLPNGTLAAVLTGYVCYIAIPILLVWRVPEADLLENPLIMVEVSAFGFLIYLGLWGATLSSALGSLLGGPRTLQALGKDSIVPKIFARSYGKDGNPRTATVLTFLIALGGILLGDLNAIAPVLSMFFLTAYGVLNLSAGFEELIANPSWRPKFKVPWWASMLGAFGCFATMFMINPGATFIALFFTGAVYYFMQRRELKARWGDVRRGILMFLARYSIYSLADMKPHAKSWRPNFLVLSGIPTSRWHLVEFAHSITRGKGFLSIGAVLSNDPNNPRKINKIQTSISDYLRKRGIPALVEVSLAEKPMEGLRALVQSYGMGPLVPNTVVLGTSQNEKNRDSFIRLLHFVHRNNRNIVIVHQGAQPYVHSSKKQIDVWWGRERQNAGLMLALGYMLLNNSHWVDAHLCLKSIVGSETEAQAANRYLSEFLMGGRLEVGLEVLVREDWKGQLANTIQESSKESDIVFLGMRPPDDGESFEDYARYYEQVVKMAEGIPQVLFVIAAEDINFTSIFT